MVTNNNNCTSTCKFVFIYLILVHYNNSTSTSTLAFHLLRNSNKESSSHYLKTYSSLHIITTTNKGIIRMEDATQRNIRTSLNNGDSGDDVCNQTALLPILHHRTPLLELYESKLRQLTSSSDDQIDPIPSQSLPQSSNTALIILNAPINNPLSPLFQQLWDSSSYRVCADGGSNRLYNSTVVVGTTCSNSSSSSSNNENTISTTTNKYIPDVITGDLDSILPETRQYYSNHGVKIVQIYDQDRHDLDKAITSVMDHFRSKQQNQQEQEQPNNNNSSQKLLAPIRCVVYGAFGGRFDQEMACFRTLYHYDGTDIKLFLYDDHTMAFLLPPKCINHIHVLLPSISLSSSSAMDANNTNNEIHHDRCLVNEGPTCGLIPLGCRVDQVTTTGLKWNLHKQPSSFDTLVSSSNHIVSLSDPDISAATTTALLPFTVTCSHPMIFTAQVHAGITTIWSER